MVVTNFIDYDNNLIVAVPTDTKLDILVGSAIRYHNKFYNVQSIEEISRFDYGLLIYNNSIKLSTSTNGIDHSNALDIDEILGNY